MTKEYLKYTIEFVNESSIGEEEKAIDKLETPEGLGKKYGWGRCLHTLPRHTLHKKSLFELIDLAVSMNLPIFLATFVLNDEAIVTKLVQAASVLRGKIYLITCFDRNEIRKVFPSDEGEHFSYLERLSLSGIRIRNAPHGHWKLALIGKIGGLITSANLTTPAYEYNPETGIELNDTQKITILYSWFVEVWKNRTTEEMIGRKVYSLDQNVNTRTLSLSRNPVGNKIRIYHTLDNEKFLDRLMSSLRSASTSIDIMTYMINLPEIVEILKRKANDGVLIRVILPALRSRYKDVLQTIFELVEHPNIEVRFFQETHAKICIVDTTLVFFSTGNFDKFLKIGSSLNLAFVSKCKEYNDEMKSFFNFVFEESNRKMLDAGERILDDLHEVEVSIKSPNSVVKWRNRWRTLSEISEMASRFEWNVYSFTRKNKRYSILVGYKEGLPPIILPFEREHDLTNPSQKIQFILSDTHFRLFELKEHIPVRFNVVNVHFYFLEQRNFEI